MPKEITHWLIAHRVTTVLQGSALGDLAEQYPYCVQLGAVMHDAAFYVRSRRWKKTVLDFADAMHGRGTDPLTIIGSVAAAAATGAPSRTGSRDAHRHADPQCCRQLLSSACVPGNRQLL